MSPITKALIVVAVGLGAAFTGILTVVAGLLAIWPALAAAFAIITGPIGIITAGVIALTAVIFLLKDQFSEFGRIGLEVIQKLAEAWSSFAEAFFLMATGRFKEGW